MPLPSYSLKELHNLFLYSQKYDRLFTEWESHSYDKQFKPSIDRINSKKPYTINNIHIMTWAENRFKQTMERRSRKGKVAQIMGEKVVKIFASQKDVVKKTGLSQANLSFALNGKRKYCGGYIWKYLNKNPELL